VVDADGIAENIELFSKNDFSVSDGTNLFASRRALIDAP